MKTSRLRNALLLFLVPTLFAAKGNCRKDKDLDDEDLLNAGTDAVLSIDGALSLVSMAPAQVQVNTPVQATLYGAGFVPGVSVEVGEQTATQVQLTDDNTLTAQVPGLAPGNYTVTVVTPDGQRASLFAGLLVTDGALLAEQCSAGVRVHFGLDQAGLSSDARHELDAKLDCFAKSQAPVAIAGHADERGTTDYNLALGQRRADAVKTHLVGQGVTPSRLDTVSYGEERPVDGRSNEDAWSKNRRADVNLAN